MIRLARILSALLFIASVLMYTTSTYALSAEQKRILFSGSRYFDLETSELCSANPSSQPTTGAARSAYFIGDSWLVRSETAIRQRAQESGIQITGLNGVVGRSISGSGEGVNALQGATADANAIAQADTIVIILGTNGDNYQARIPEFMRSFRNKNVYWVNTSANATRTIATSASNANRAITANATGNYSVIDWFRIVYPTGDPVNIDTNARSPLMDSDRIHPSTPEGVERLTELIFENIAGSEAGDPQTPTGGTPNQSGDFTLTSGNTSITLSAGWNEIITAAAARFQVDPYILAGILRVETRWPDPATVEAQRIRNSATATGPFQILDLALQDISDRPDSSYPSTRPTPSGRLIRQVGGTGTAQEADGSLILDGNKDGQVDRHNPWDAAFMAAAFVNSLGGTVGLPIGSPTDAIGTAAQEIRAGTNTVRKVLAHYNQGGGWSSTRAVQGRNDVEAYMDRGSEAYLALQAVNWFSGVASSPIQNAAGCTNVVNPLTRQLQWPLATAGNLTACWSDLRTRTESGGTYYHSGIDVSGAEGSNILSVAAGTIVFIGQHSAYGNLVIIDHNGLWSHYGHLDGFAQGLEEGQTVTAGQIIGTLGNTGVSTGPHLHLNLYNRWPFGSLPEGAASSDGRNTINPLTNGLTIPTTATDTAGCANYPNGGREDSVAI